MYKIQNQISGIKKGAMLAPCNSHSGIAVRFYKTSADHHKKDRHEEIADRFDHVLVLVAGMFGKYVADFLLVFRVDRRRLRSTRKIAQNRDLPQRR